MSKDEILQRELTSDEYDFVQNKINFEDAMDEFSKQECIGFLKFAAIEGWYYWKKTESWTNDDDDFKSTEELYKHFIKSKQ